MQQVRLHEGPGDKSQTKTHLWSSLMQDSWLTQRSVSAVWGKKGGMSELQQSDESLQSSVPYARSKTASFSLCALSLPSMLVLQTHICSLFTVRVFLCETEQWVPLPLSVYAHPSDVLNDSAHTGYHADIDLTLLDQYMFNLSAGPYRSAHTPQTFTHLDRQWPQTPPCLLVFHKLDLKVASLKERSSRRIFFPKMANNP